MAPLLPKEKTVSLVAALKAKLVACKALSEVSKVYKSHAEKYFLTGPFADYRLERFLIKNKGSVDAALKEIKKCIDTRNKKNYWMCTIEDEEELKKCVNNDKMLHAVKESIKTGCFYLQGEDLAARPNIFCKLRNIPKDADVENVSLGAVFVMDALERQLDAKRFAVEGQKSGVRVGEGEKYDAKWNMVMDCGNMQISSSTGRKIGIDLVGTMLAFYPERGNKTFLIDPDWCVWAVLKLIQPFLCAEQKSKIVQFTRSRDFVSKKKNVPELAKIVDAKFIDVEYGGSYKGKFDGEQLCRSLHKNSSARSSVARRTAARKATTGSATSSVRCSAFSGGFQTRGASLVC